MKKDAFPKEFPVGRLRGLLHSVSPAGRNRPPFLPRPQLITPFGGPVLRNRNLAGLDHDRQTLSARGDGTLSQIVAAKSSPTSIRGNGPELGTGSPPLGMADIRVQQGSGTVRDANVSKAAWAREAIKTAAKKKKIDPRLLAIDPSDQHLTPALSLQAGMGQVRKLMWKHMDPKARSNYVMRKAVPPSPA